MTTPQQSAFKRFIDAGLRDADRRLSWFVRPLSVDTPDLVSVADSSIAVRGAERMLAIARRAAMSSRLAGYAATSAAEWRHWPSGAQRFGAGITLLAAVAVHVGLTLWVQPPPGFFWLIVPGLAAAAGMLLVLASAFWKGFAAPR